MKKWTWASVAAAILLFVIMIRVGASYTSDKIVYGRQLTGTEYSCQKAQFFDRDYVFVWNNTDHEVTFIHVDDDYSQIAEEAEENGLSEVLVLLRAEDSFLSNDGDDIDKHYQPAAEIADKIDSFASWNVMIFLLMVYPFLAFICIGLLNGVLEKHSAITKFYCTAQLLLIVFLIGSIVIYAINFTRNYDSETTKSMARFAASMSDTATDRLSDAVRAADMDLYEFIELDVKSDEIKMISSLRLYEETNLADYYGSGAAQMVQEAYQDGKTCTGCIQLPIGRCNAVACCYSTGDAKRGFFLLAPFDSLKSAFIDYAYNSISNMVFLFGIVSLILIATMLVFRARWRKLNEAIEKIIIEKEDYPIPTKNVGGFLTIWRGISQANRALGSVRYDVSQGLKTGLKFVPKNLIKLFEKKTLTDVAIGDFKSVEGCVVQISMDNMKSYDGADYMQLLNTANDIMVRNQDKCDAIRVNCDPDLKKNKFFFSGQADTAINFAIDVAHELSSDSFTRVSKRLLMINKSEYNCGMAGSDDQIVPFVYSKDDEILESYEEQLRNAGIEVVLTDNVLGSIENKNSIRYLGYITSTKNNRSIKLYENLDVYSEFKRKVILSTEQTFQKGLKMFYSDDFYLARNTFNEVIQVNPNDQIARWYLFTCEHYLNAEGNVDVSYSLFDNREE